MPTDNLRNELEEIVDDGTTPEGGAPEGDEAKTGTEADPQNGVEHGAGEAPKDEDPLAVQLDGDDVPEKFKGKSVRDVIKSYKELESRLGKRNVGSEERAALKDAGIDPAKLPDADELKQLVEQQDFSKMDPAKFALWLLQLVDKRGSERVQTALQSQQQVTQTVKADVREAQAKYPLLKTTKEFRDIVLSIIEASQARGEQVTLLEACDQAQNALRGLGLSGAVVPEKKSTEEKKKGVAQKIKNATVETDTGAPANGETPSDGDEIRQGMIAAGTNGLGF